MRFSSSEFEAGDLAACEIDFAADESMREDWVESWAHYLHVVDSLDTALRFGLRGEDVEQAIEPFTVKDLYDSEAADAQRVILLVNSWVQLTTVLNELSRSMGQQDFYPVCHVASGLV